MADGFGEDEAAVDVVEAARLQTHRRVVEDGNDELFGCDRHEEDAAEDGERLVEELEGIGALRSRILQLVAEGWAKEVIPEVADGEVLRVGHPSHGGGELFGQILTELGNRRDMLVLVQTLRLIGIGCTQGLEDMRIANSRGCRCLRRDRVVQLLEAVQCGAEMTVVESVRVHLHEQGQQV